MVRVSPFRSFTQGTIFSCARAEEYPKARVYGIIVTARCDAAHGKAAILNYVPIVRFEDWLLQDGARMLGRRVEADSIGSMKGAIRDAGMTSDILDIVSTDEIIDELEKVPGKAGPKIVERFRGSLSSRSAAVLAASGKMTQEEIKQFITQNLKHSNGIIRELLANSLAEYHFLEAVEPDEEDDGYVILLREVRFLPLIVAAAVEAGLDREALETVVPNLDDRRSIQLNLDDENLYAMPLGTVQSPDVELILQRFTQLFARIGVADFSSHRIARLNTVISRLKDQNQ